MFSERTEWDRRPTELASRLAALRDAGERIIDLTESNPTRCGLAYRGEAILGAIAQPDALVYEPAARGTDAAREAIARRLCDANGPPIHPRQIVLTSSTSEAYSWLFKLLGEPGLGDQFLIPSPSYPLFEYLAQLEGVRVVRYPLLYEGERWRLDIVELAHLIEQCSRPKAVVVVQPNNPTGSALDAAEIEELDRLCAKRELAIIADEVFADYPFADEAPIVSLIRCREPSALTFVLGGLSKLAGLPQMKLSWIVAGGSPEVRDEALERLEIIGDTFLSVGTPVQTGIDALLEAGAEVRQQILRRVRGNRMTLATICGEPGQAWDCLGAEGGWYAVLRLPRVKTEEEWALELLEMDRIHVHPGYLFDFEGEGYVVVSLLAPEGEFEQGIRRLALRVLTSLA